MLRFLALLFITTLSGPAPPGTATVDICPNGDVWVSANEITDWQLSGTVTPSAVVNMPAAGGSLFRTVGENRITWPFSYTDLYVGRVVPDPSIRQHHVLYHSIRNGTGDIAPARYPDSCPAGTGVRLPESYPPNNSLLDFGDIEGAEIYAFSILDKFDGRLANYEFSGAHAESFRLENFLVDTSLATVHTLNVRFVGSNPGESTARLSVTLNDPHAVVTYDIRANLVTATNLPTKHTAIAWYNVNTGQLTVSANQVSDWQVGDTHVVAQHTSSFLPFSGTENAVLAPGLHDLSLAYTWMSPSQGRETALPVPVSTTVPVTVIPEPRYHYALLLVLLFNLTHRHCRPFCRPRITNYLSR